MRYARLRAALLGQGGSRRALQTTFDWDARRGVLQQLAGQNGRGRWALVVRDSVGADSGTLRTFSLRLACAAPGEVVTPPASTQPTRPSRTEIRDPWGGRLRTPPVTRPQPQIISPWQPQPPQPVQPPRPPPTGRSNPRTDGVVNPWE
jgi:hypothetical protein